MASVELGTTPTHLSFHHDGSLSRLDTKLLAVIPFSTLDEKDRGLFKLSDEKVDNYSAIITEATIFHPQGGGQPSDQGIIETSDLTFNVIAARTSVILPGVVLHVGNFSSPSSGPFEAGTTVTQEIDTKLRLLYSKYHTAGHVLGSAVRLLLENEVPGFDELKASHFPDSASCEFAGSIPGSHKDDIQRKVDEFVEKDMPVEIDWWDAEEFKKNGLERLTPDASFLMPGETKFRIVRIVGAEVYPCGGTHVGSTRECGKTTVKKIGRSKGTSRVSYTVA